MTALAARCRSCGGANLELILSLGETPLANALLTADVPFGVPSAASTSARLVSDLEPGIVTVACTGICVDGACQLLTPLSCLVVFACHHGIYVWAIRGDHRSGVTGGKDQGN